MVARRSDDDFPLQVTIIVLKQLARKVESVRVATETAGDIAKGWFSLLESVA